MNIIIPKIYESLDERFRQIMSVRNCGKYKYTLLTYKNNENIKKDTMLYNKITKI